MNKIRTSTKLKDIFTVPEFAFCMNYLLYSNPYAGAAGVAWLRQRFPQISLILVSLGRDGSRAYYKQQRLKN